MRFVRVLVLLGFLVMTAVLAWALVAGDIAREGAILTSMPWGVVSLFDVYVGFLLFGGWVLYRETSRARGALWVVGVLVLGNWLSCLYVLLALAAARGDARRFWLGARA
jgi:hypothetical protein